jgi:hypothetical protein
VNGLFVDFVFFNRLFVSHQKPFQATEIGVYLLSIILQDLDDNFVRLLLLIECEFVLASLKSTESPNLAQFVVCLLKIKEPLILFNFVLLVVLVQPQSLKQKNKQINEPNNCNLEVDRKG